MAEETVANRALTPGEETSEGKLTAKNNLFGTILMIAGTLTGIVPSMIDAIRAVPGVETSKTGLIILSVLGGVLAIAGAIVKAAANSSYNQGRALIKASAIRDVPPDKIAA